MRLVDADAYKAEGRELYREAGWDLRDAFRDGQDNECSCHWGVRKAEPWYMKDEVENG